MYKKYIKRLIDIILSLMGLIIASWLYLIIMIAIVLDDPGPVFFTQRRVGKGKNNFQLAKFRSMKMATPHDTPTHLLENPDQYITRVGYFLRKTSLDEIPQLWNILKGDMSVIGPRPALWNQYNLIEERDKYGANDVRPGLSGWAQICGRDQLEIEDKARLDGEYVQKMSFFLDCRCFFGTAFSALRGDGVVEGGTGEMHKKADKKSDKNGSIDFSEPIEIEHSAHRRVLIAGAHSYIGESFEVYANEYDGADFKIETISVRDDSWKSIDFSSYDCILHVAGIAHIKEKENNRQLYYKVNRDLTVELAIKAKEAGVRQFIVISSMSVYGVASGHIMKYTIPNPINAYGESKLQADVFLNKIEDNTFKVAVLRPPMVYGKNCKGNYQALRTFALKSPIFPSIFNQRSMIYIGNLCEFICKIINEESRGIFFPQNEEYVSTSKMVQMIAKLNGKKIVLIPIFNPLIRKFPTQILKKVFENLTYERVDTVDTFDFMESLRLSEEKEE